MSKFLETCRQCYALIGLAIIAACGFSTWAAGWLANKLGHMVGLMPFGISTCWPEDCWAKPFDGPESVIGFMFFGVVAIGLSWILWLLGGFVFAVLEALGQEAVHRLKERRA